MPTGDIELRVTNLTGRPMEVQVKDHGYKSGDHMMTIEPAATGRSRCRLESQPSLVRFQRRQSPERIDFYGVLRGV